MGSFFKIKSKLLKRQLACLLALFIVATGMGFNTSWATAVSRGPELPISLFLNAARLSFDVPPQMVNNRVLVPFRGLLESMGATVSWDATHNIAYAITPNLTIGMPVGKSYATINGLMVPLDVSATLYNNRVLIPTRFVATTLGASVRWDNTLRTVYIQTEGTTNSEIPQPPSVTSPSTTNEDPSPEIPQIVTSREILLGNTLEALLGAKGEPTRKDLSQYGFTWYVYADDYKAYEMVGVRSGKVVAKYGFSDFKMGNYKALIGQTASTVRKSMGTPVTQIIRGNVAYNYNDDHIDIFLHGKASDGVYTRIFYDQFNKDGMSAYLTLYASEEARLSDYYGKASAGLQAAFERQMMDLTNGSRAKFGLGAFEWSDSAQKQARAHSADMAKRSYFNHVNPDGMSPFDRLEASGVIFRAAAENLAAGQIDAIHAHHALMNSQGHRKNILADYEKISVGVAFGGKMHQYFTISFFTPR